MDSHRVWGLGCCAFLLSGLLGFADPAMTISSPAFAQGAPMPSHFAYTGDNVSPELDIAHVPANAKSLVLIVDDPDAPMGIWTHWLVWNLSPTITTIPEGKLPPDAREGKNSFGPARYDGPAPPSGTHRYFFRVYALDELFFPKFRTASDRDAILAEIKGHVVGTGETFGTYSASP
jgi:Raf kinase inhibitor-like YbhB/YbcL family protein